MRGKKIVWNLAFEGLAGRGLLGFCGSWPEFLRGIGRCLSTRCISALPPPFCCCRGRPGLLVSPPHHRRDECFSGASLKAYRVLWHFWRAGLQLVHYDIPSISHTELLSEDLLNEPALQEMNSEFSPLFKSFRNPASY